MTYFQAMFSSQSVYVERSRYAESLSDEREQ